VLGLGGAQTPREPLRRSREPVQESRRAAGRDLGEVARAAAALERAFGQREAPSYQCERVTAPDGLRDRPVDRPLLNGGSGVLA